MSEHDSITPCTIYYCGKEDCKKGHTYGPAVRNQYLLHFVTAGRGKYTVNGHTYPVEQNQLFLIKPNELTVYIADAQEPWSYIWVGFDGYDVKKILQHCHIGYVTTVPQPDRFAQHLLTLLTLLETGDDNPYRKLSVFYDMMSDFYQSEQPTHNSFDALYFKKAVTYLLNNFAYPITVAEVANHVGVERSYLYKIFIKNCNQSPKQYLLDLRIQNAAKMMAQTELSLAQIALSSGFTSAPQFCTHFKKAEGITPRQYKKDLLSFRTPTLTSKSSKA